MRAGDWDAGSAPPAGSQSLAEKLELLTVKTKNELLTPEEKRSSTLPSTRSRSMHTPRLGPPSVRGFSGSPRPGRSMDALTPRTRERGGSMLYGGTSRGGTPRRGGSAELTTRPGDSGASSTGGHSGGSSGVNTPTDTIRLSKGGQVRRASLGRLREVFDLLDIDRSGTVTEQELESKLRVIGPASVRGAPETQYLKLVNSFRNVLSKKVLEGVDKGHMGFRFRDLLHALYPLANKDELGYMEESSRPTIIMTSSLLKEVEMAFQRADVDGNGVISQEEFLDSVADRVSEALARQMFEESDGDGSEGLDLEEFAEWYLKFASKRAYQEEGL